MNEYDKRDDRIAYGQALNLAVEYAIGFGSESLDTPEKRQKAVLEAREWFYNELRKTPPRTKEYEQKNG